MDNYINPKAPTLARTYDATITTSTAITLASGTSVIIVSAIDKGIFMKWGATASSTAFDEFINANTTQQFVVQASTVQFIQESATAKLVVVEK